MAKMKTFLGSLALVTTLAVAPGCGDKKKADDSAEAAKKDGDEKKADSEEKKVEDKPAAAEAGATFAFMPAACEQGRVYINMKGLSTGASGTMEEIEEKMMGALGGGDAETAEKVMKVLKDGGFEPQMLHEVSVCIDKDGEPTIAMAHDPGLKEPLELFAKAIEAAGKPKPEIEKKDGVALMKNPGAGKDGALAAPKAGILLLGKGEETLSALYKGGDGADGFADAKGQLVWAKVVETKPTKPDIEFKLVDGGKSLDADLRVTMKGPQGKAIADDPKTSVAEMEKQRDQFVAQIEKSPFAMLAEPVKNVELSTDGPTMVVKGKIAKELLDQFGKKMGEMKPEELMKAF